MKAKIKVRLQEDSYRRYLYIKVKIEPEKFYWHEEKIISGNVYDNYGHWEREKTDLEFYTEVIEFMSNKDNIKNAGERIVKDIISNNEESYKSNLQEKKVKELLKKLKEPIEIEIED